jgi:hypothetical protein
LKLKLMLAIAGLAALAITSGTATAGNGDKVTGGGQILVGSSGAGSTIAFNGQGTTTDAKGQIQSIDRSGGKGQEVKIHVAVDCVEVDDAYGILGGFQKKNGKLTTDRYTLRVVDGGEPNLGVDMIAFTPENDDARCGDPEADNEEPEVALGRGNAQVRDGDPNNPPAEEQSSSSTGLSLLGL